MSVKIKKKKMFDVNCFELNKSLNKVFKTRVCISNIPIIVHIRNLSQLCSRKMTATANVSDVVIVK